MEISTFNNEEFGEIRTIQENGEVLFCGADIAKALGYSNTRDALSRHCNAKIANILEYGTSGQSAKPFLKPAKSAVKKQCMEIMKSAFEKEVKGL